MVFRHYAIIDSEHNVLMFGKNDHGQLGIGNKQDQKLPVKIKTLPPIISTSVGAVFTLFLDDKGSVWFSGKIPHTNYVSQSDEPLKIENVRDIIKISSGEHHCLLLDQNGDVFSFGSNNFGKLGRPCRGKNVPTKIENLPKIKDVCCGISHSVVIDFDGNCFSFGENSVGQLGLGDKTNRIIPVKIENLPPIQSCSADCAHTIFIDSDETAYVCGFGGHQLEDMCYMQIPIRTNFKGISGIKKAYCFGFSTILCDIDNNFWSFRQNCYKELNLDDPNSVVIVPTKITTIVDIDSVICYRYSNIFINKKGECFLRQSINEEDIPDKMEDIPDKMGDIPDKMEDSSGSPIRALIFRPKRFNKTKNARNQL